MVDLVLDPDPTPSCVAQVMARFPFRDRATAHQNLMALAREDFQFLSQARCRHFLAAIAPRLLDTVGRTPDPDLTLTNLEKVSASLGAKAILWELFNFNPPSLRLYVELCATSQFLSEILINNPGMIDDLIDSLVVDRPSPGAAIQAELAELCTGAEDLAPILWSFRNKEWVRIGTRDILGREPIRDVTPRAGRRRRGHRRARWPATSGTAGPSDSARPDRGLDGRRDRWAILGLGKLGGRELNYHSDLDLVFLHEGDGRTEGGEVRSPTTSSSPRSSIACSRRSAAAHSTGPLYAVDARLRPHGALGTAGPDPRRLPRLPGAIDPDLGADGLHRGPA